MADDEEEPKVSVTPTAASGMKSHRMPLTGKYSIKLTRNPAATSAVPHIRGLRKRSMSVNDLLSGRNLQRGRPYAVPSGPTKVGATVSKSGNKNYVSPLGLDNRTRPAASKATSRYVLQPTTKKAKVGPATIRVALAPSPNEEKPPEHQSLQECRRTYTVEPTMDSLMEQLSKKNEELAKERNDCVTLLSENKALKAQLDIMRRLCGETGATLLKFAAPQY